MTYDEDVATFHGHDFDGVPRVMWPVKDVPADEGLMGLVFRTAVENIYECTTPILEAAGLPHHVSFNLAVRPELDCARLAHVLRLSEDRIISLRYGDLQATYGPPTVDFFGAPVARYDLRLRSRRIAPMRLAADPNPYHRAIWELGLLPVDLATGEWLVDRCPRCSGRLGWYHSRNLAVCGDARCGFDLRDAEPSRLEEKRFEMIASVGRLLDPAPAVHEAAVASLPPPVRSLGRGAAFELVWRLGRATTPQGMATRDQHKSLPPEEIVDALCAGAALMLDWPGSLDRHVRDRMATTQEGAVEFMQALRGLGRCVQSWAGHGDVMRASVPHLVTTGRRACISVMNDGVDGDTARRILRIDAATLARARNLGLLTTSLPGGNVNVHALFSRSELEIVRGQLDDRMRSGSLAERLGITQHGVEQLVCLGAIEQAPGSFVRELYVGLQIARSSADALIRTLETMAVSSVADDPDSISLRRALMLVGGREKPWGPIVLALRDGTVPFGLSPEGRPLVARIRVPRDAIASIVQFAFDRADHDFPYATEVNRRDAQELLNLTPCLMKEALKNDLAEAHLEGRRLRLDVTLGVARRRISGGEILARWGSGRWMPVQLRDQRRFRRLGATGWHRGEVEACLAEVAEKKIRRPGGRPNGRVG